MCRCDLEVSQHPLSRCYQIQVSSPRVLDAVLGARWERAEARAEDGCVQAVFPITLVYSHDLPNVLTFKFDGFRRENRAGFVQWDSSSRKRKAVEEAQQQDGI